MKRKKKVKPISFRLYPEGSFLFCDVNIWPTKKAMYEHLPLGRNHEASCGGRECYIVPPNGRMRKTGLFAEANFHRQRIGIEVVTHELTHGAFAFAERRRLSLNEVITNKEWNQPGHGGTMDQDGPEERFCYALGVMCRQFTQKCYDRGLYEDVVIAPKRKRSK